MPLVYDKIAVSPALRRDIHALLRTVFAQPNVLTSQTALRAGLRTLRHRYGQEIPQTSVVQIYREDAGQQQLPPLNEDNLARIRLKPMRSHSGIQSVAVLTKPFPCPGKCIFCPNDIRMPKSYIASEPGAQRAERHSFDPYLQTYSRLEALENMGHIPSKIELIVLGGTWSYYPESYQIWFIHECLRALNDYSHSQDDRDQIRQAIANSVRSGHRQENRVVNEQDIAIDGRHVQQTYNQVVSQHYLAPEIMTTSQAWSPREQATWDQLEAQQLSNEQARCRLVGLTLETRPDNISEAEVIRLRRLGATKTQIGVQSLSDHVLELNHRGHDTAATRRAIKLLRQAGFKIHAHWMINLYGSNPEKDCQEYDALFTNDDYKPDELKIYPCALIPSAELMAYYERGEWQPYSTEQLEKVLRYALTNTPEWVRLTRVVRDIPATEVAAGEMKTNHRQIVEQQIEQDGGQVRDIRAREIRHHQPQLPVVWAQQTYTTSSSQEVFIQAVDQQRRILGFVRLSLPREPSYLAELGQDAIIRELHVYGQTRAVSNSHALSESESADQANLDWHHTQHRGLGKQLLHLAQQAARDHGYDRLHVISAIGTRAYYRRQGFQDGELYQSMKL